jgi:hypothetical protein
MADLDLVLEVPERGMDLVLGQRGEAHRRDELRPAFGQHASDVAAALLDQAHELARLVGGDAAADDQQDARRNHSEVFYSHAQSPSSAKVAIASPQGKPGRTLPWDG